MANDYYGSNKGHFCITIRPNILKRDHSLCQEVLTSNKSQFWNCP